MIQKLNSINIPRVLPLEEGNAQTVEEFWNQFIVTHLPEKSVVLQWHKVLMEYIKEPRAMFTVRGYNSAAKTDYDSLRRGFLTKTSAGYSFFYTDNFHAAYYLKMALDGYVPTVDELLYTYNTRQFPARFGRDTSNERAMMAIPKGIDPGIQNAGYKIAHILNVGKNYSVNGQNVPLSRIMSQYFDGGQRSDWAWHTDETGAYYLRLFEIHPAAKKYLVAEFLRFVHPFNYFLTPKKKCSCSTVCSDIAEYQPLLDYVQQKFAELYGGAYQEYFNLVMPTGHIPYSVSSDTRIGLKHSRNISENISARLKGKEIVDKAVLLPQQKQLTEKPALMTKNLELRIVKEYLLNPDTSFRKLERQFMGIDSQAKGGGFIAKRIVNSYGVTAEMKGVLSRCSVSCLIETATGRCKVTLQKIEKEL